MVRRLLFIAAVLLAMPAQAGMRATYSDGKGEKELIVEVADTGDARISERGKQDYGLLKDDVFYVIGREGGHATVARIEDIAGAIDQVVPPIFRDIFGKAAQGMPVGRKLGIEKLGPREVGGQPGALYRISGMNDENLKESVDFVISNDPRLRPVGRALEQFMNASILPGAVFIGPAAAEIVGETHQIFALGTPLDVGGRFRLVAVDSVEIPHERMELPAKPRSVDQLVEAMRAQQQAEAPAP